MERKTVSSTLTFIMIFKNKKWHWEEGIIIDKIGNVLYSVATKDIIKRAHTNQLRPRFVDSLNDSSLSLFTLFESVEKDF